MKQTIKRESTWDYDTYDENGLQDGGTETVETIETWEYNQELGRYELTYLEEKETGKYIPYSEDEYIRNMTDPIPVEKDYYKAYEKIDDMLDDIGYLRKQAGLELPFNLFQDKWNVRGEIELSNADPIVGFKKNGKFYIDRELISCAI